ncbi:thiol-disulfide isomerase/thioredoxin [Duganella sp. 3397]|uniref:thioredoxin family protein n=1 Tax=Duganella sp. 3397 TaxID=2817732 RepID=UPI00285E0512|nr:thioredoxin family protein [Duganella sp. 3397]MDR7047951.1 thiol-disulfide isomerase/thioredoxin [Duganella sp. 3397]
MRYLLNLVPALVLAAAALSATGAHAAPVPPQPAPALAGIDRWLNSPPLSIAQLRGKVVLVDFWTYTCIHCIRTLPHVQAWHARYRDQGLVVVGVHTPEYPVERSTANVQAAITRFGITYPVAQDNGYQTWQAYNNRYWPAVYLVNKRGQIVYQHFGEGAYAETEKTIRALLAEPG